MTLLSLHFHLLLFELHLELTHLAGLLFLLRSLASLLFLLNSGQSFLFSTSLLLSFLFKSCRLNDSDSLGLLSLLLSFSLSSCLLFAMSLGFFLDESVAFSLHHVQLISERKHLVIEIHDKLLTMLLKLLHFLALLSLLIGHLAHIGYFSLSFIKGTFLEIDLL